MKGFINSTVDAYHDHLYRKDLGIGLGIAFGIVLVLLSCLALTIWRCRIIQRDLERQRHPDQAWGV